MFFTIYFFSLIFLIVPLYGEYYLIVPFNEVYGPLRDSPSFKYNGKIYDEYKEMIDKIKKDFYFIPQYCLYLELKSKVLDGKDCVVKNDGHYSKLVQSSYNPTFTFSLIDFPLKLKYSNFKNIYICEGNMYTKLKDAKNCVDDFRKFTHIRTQSFKLGKHFMSSHVWHKVWIDCYYECFAMNNFKNLKINLFDELNLLRLKLGVRPLKYNGMMELYADRRGQIKYGVSKKQAMEMEKNPFYEITACISPGYASTQMNNWFMQFLSINPKTKSNKKYTKRHRLLKILFSSTIRYVAFGTVKEGEKFTIVCVFN